MGNKLITGLRNFLAVSVPAGVFAFLVAELVFRFAIPASNPPLTYFDTESEILRFDVGGARQGTTTKGNLSQQRTRWQINNVGWNSEVDYVSGSRDNPLISIIGDSTTQALDVNVEDSIASRLRQLVGAEYDVYSFAKGGGALSQFLHLSRYADQNFDPDILVFNIEANNFDQSLCDVAHPVGMMCLHDENPDIRESTIVPYASNRTQRWARKSSLVRYVVFNLGFTPSVRRAEAKTIDGGPGRDSDVLLKQRVERSTAYILERIALENPGKPVVFMLDAPRNHLYDGSLEHRDDFRSWARDLMERLSDEYSFSFLDLTAPFMAAYQEDGQRFESIDGFHWNKRGHAVAAEALFERLKHIGAIE